MWSFNGLFRHRDEAPRGQVVKGTAPEDPDVLLPDGCRVQIQDGHRGLFSATVAERKGGTLILDAEEPAIVTVRPEGIPVVVRRYLPEDEDCVRFSGLLFPGLDVRWRVSDLVYLGHGNEREAFRIRVNRPGMLQTADGNLSCTVRDVSGSGVQLRLSRETRRFLDGMLGFSVGDGAESMLLPVKSVWFHRSARELLCGCTFVFSDLLQQEVLTALIFTEQRQRLKTK